jgi:sterol desaturase/sphingolipid hydroxylase (fatty acid hydroxylase superfamily)
MNINTFITQNEAIIRLSFFFGVFIVMALWEWLAPRRQLVVPKLLRWVNNLLLVFLNTIILRLLFPAAAVGMAIFAREQGWGIFNYFDTPLYVSVITSVIVMDAMIYLQHVMVHAVPALWRLHRVHHADPDIDVTTGARFHPLEIILSMLIKFAVIIVLGAPVLAVIIFEILLNATAMFNHSNVRLNLTVDKFLRLFVVTPDMHRVHHSVEVDETNSNFGFNLPWWDRLFGTYRAQPRAGHENMTIGIHRYNQPSQVTWLHKMLLLPFIGKITDYAINRRYE